MSLMLDCWLLEKLELQERVLSAQTVGGYQRRLQPIREQWLIAPLSSALQCGAVNFTDHKTSEKLPHRDEPHRAWILEKRETVRSLAVFWDCTVTFALLLDFTAFSHQLCVLFCYLTRASAGLWSASRLRRDRTAVELRESRVTERWQRRKRRRGEFSGLWGMFSVVNSALRVFVELQQQVYLYETQTRCCSSHQRHSAAHNDDKKEKCPVFCHVQSENVASC